MAAKLNAKLVARLKNAGVKNTTSEETAKAELLKKIEKEYGVDGLESEDIDTLLEMIEAMADDDDTPEVEDDEPAEEVEEVEDEDEPEDDEPEEPVKKTAKKAVSATPTKAKKVTKVVEPEEEDDEDEEPEVEETKPAKKAVPATKQEAKANMKKVPATKVKVTEKTTEKPVRLNPKENEDDREYLAFVLDEFPEKQFIHAYTAAGVSIKYKGVNSARCLFSIEAISVHPDGTVTCDVYLMMFQKREETLVEDGWVSSMDDMKYSWNGCPVIKKMTNEDLSAFIEDYKDFMVGGASKTDKRLGANREKMEENLKGTSKKSAAPAVVPSKKVVKVVEDEPEDDDEEDEAPAPKAKSVHPTSTKKVVKKGKK